MSTPGAGAAARWVLIGTAALAIFALFQARRWSHSEVFEHDAGGYVAPLHSLLIVGTLGRADSLESAQRHYRPQSAGNIGAVRLPNGRVITKYFLGLAVVNAPWYVGAHLWARAGSTYPADGYSRPYQQAIMLAGLVWGLAGLWLLRGLLRRWFTDGITAWTLAAVGLGTNLLNYSTYEAAMAHSALFMWQVGLLAASVRWHTAPRLRTATGIGLCLGMAVLTRPTDALFGLVPLLWGVHNLAALRARPALLWRYRAHLLLAGGVALAIASIQLVYWRLTSDHWFLNSYGDEGFDFGHPHLLDGLFSFRKGWLLYTPLMGLALLGIPAVRRWVPAAWGLLLVLVPVVIYVTFSWREWYYGGSFSCRPLISLYPLLALPLAALLAAVRPRRAWPVLAALVVVLIGLNLLQTWQYHRAILHWQDTTAAAYFRNFFVVWR